jgi:hypothetical protein
MPLLSQHPDPRELDERLRDAHALTAELISDVIGETCRRFPSMGQTGKTDRIEQWIGSGAWIDAVLALVDLELSQWQIRRIAYDDGEWYCALSRQRELPDWLDRFIECRHADLPIAILRAYVEAQRISAPLSTPSVPSVDTSPLYEPACCDNFS